MDIVAIGMAFIRLVLGIVFAVAALYIATWVLGKLTKEFNEWEEIAKGNYAVAVYIAGVFISVAIIVGPGISGLFRTLDLVGIMLGFIQLVIALGIAVVAQYIGLSTLSKLVKTIDVWAELKNKNVAVGIVAAAIVIAVGTIVSQGVESIILAIFV
jgi:uncharacterized membrane protein YjfL (UPF0719 family)